MDTIMQTPEWLGTAVIGAIIAALGYVAKVMIEAIQSYIEKKRILKARLVELQSLLRASQTAFIIQNKHAKMLTEWIRTNHAGVKMSVGYENLIAAAFPVMNKEEKELHAIIRSMTIHALYPVNQAMREWLKADVFFKAQKSHLAVALRILESHLLLWIAKYEAWISTGLDHALIYMADEHKHGLGFPNEVDKLVDKEIENMR